MQKLITQFREMLNMIEKMDIDLNDDGKSARDMQLAQEDIRLSKHYLKKAINRIITAKFYEEKKDE